MTTTLRKKASQRLHRWYRQSFYPALKWLEQNTQRAIFTGAELVNREFNPFRRWGVARKVVVKHSFPRIPVAGEEDLLRRLPDEVDGQPLNHYYIDEHKAISRPVEVHQIPNGFATNGAAHLSTNGDLLWEISEEFSAIAQPKKHSLLTFKRSRLPVKITPVKGTVASLVADGHQNVYHWLTDVIPRLEQLELSPASVDAYYLPTNQRFQRESLEILGIPREKIICSEAHPIIQAETLLVPSFYLHPYGERCGHFPVPKRAVEFIRKKFLPHVLTEKTTKRVFISRRGAQRRRIANEDQLLPLLKERGFTVIAMEKLSFMEQVSVFSDAECIVAPHGAGLVYLAFAPKNCRILEIFAPRSTTVCFWTLNGLDDRPYQHLYGEEGHAETESGVDEGFDHIVVDPAKFEKALDAIDQ